jgi:hypothetical protein
MPASIAVAAVDTTAAEVRAAPQCRAAAADLAA